MVQETTALTIASSRTFVARVIQPALPLAVCAAPAVEAKVHEMRTVMEVMVMEVTETEVTVVMEEILQHLQSTLSKN